MNVEEEPINKIMMYVQKYVNDDDLPNVKDDVMCMDMQFLRNRNTKSLSMMITMVKL